ncbi:hypothetical protein NADFUDRAFT_47558 [Nadsonia fulvescens var. elongata DSM 6958]|uniref:alpha-1,2-Mannosidase n=1 Tax=Nadsonia fulvescens var. elongata DSM 6958 TaxID=857566 RepID=A0A1E3PG42_9ASCO|nr:hypothetical protein NADFUDRAFT_47558 [Nadsonia fulvescens var. elongata DSM 6958]
MAFDRPGITPNFLAKNRHAEDNAWKAKSNSSRNNHGGSELPLYKDKPFDGTSQRRAMPRGQKLVIGITAAICLYIIYSFGQSLNGTPSYLFGLGHKAEPAVDWAQRQQQVKQVFQESWADYALHAWGKDVYHPITQTGKDLGPEPMGWIIVDSVDTAMIMGLDKEVAQARDWIKNKLNYDMDLEVNTFETTIRMLGGLLSAHYLSKDDVYLDQAADLGNRLLGAFDSKSGLPLSSVNLKTGKAIKSHDGGLISTAEASTLQLELKYLSKLTGEDLYWKAAEKVLQIVDFNAPPSGLVPIYIDPETGKFQSKNIRLGSRGDSYYEYLLKQYLQTNKKEDIYRDMYEEAVLGIEANLVAKSHPNELTFLGELPQGITGSLSNKMDHLVCFMGGLLALGATEGQTLEDARRGSRWKTSKENDMKLARELTRTCYEIYSQTASGLAPEIVQFNTDKTKDKDFTIKSADAHNLQRPETIESLFVLWRITKDPIYREWGWEIFQSFKKWTKVENEDGSISYTSLGDVNVIPPKQRDNMESFWLAETLKYLYLLFDDSEKEKFPLNEVVFNTEAHPLPIFDMEPLFTTGWVRAKGQKTSPPPANVAQG